jgi:hypothetical protein
MIAFDASMPQPAADAILHRIEGFIKETEAERLRLYRLHLQATIRRVSPLISDSAAFAGSRLRVLVEDLSPPPSWPWRMAGTPFHNPFRAAKCSANGPASLTRPGVLRKAGAKNWLTRSFNGMRGELSLVVEGGSLEAFVSLGTAYMQTHAGVASVMLPDPLPETVAAALPGRLLEELVQHPIIDGRGYVVDQVHPPTHWPGHVVIFRTGLLPFDMPWGDALAAELGDGM